MVVGVAVINGSPVVVVVVVVVVAVVVTHCCDLPVDACFVVPHYVCTL